MRGRGSRTYTRLFTGPYPVTSARWLHTVIYDRAQVTGLREIALCIHTTLITVVFFQTCYLCNSCIQNIYSHIPQAAMDKDWDSFAEILTDLREVEA